VIAGPERRQIREALFRAFPTRARLEALLDGLDRPLAHYASEQVPLSDAVFAVVRAAQDEGWLTALLREAVAANPGSPDLATVLHQTEIVPPTAPPVEAIFANRVQEACADRYPGAEIMVFHGPEGRPTYLSAAWKDDGYRRRWPVGIAPGGVDENVLARFIDQVHAEFERADPRVESELIHGGPLPDKDLVREARRRGVLIRSLTEYQRLWDPRRYLEEQRARHEANPSYVTSLYVSQRFTSLDDPPATPPRHDLFGDVADWLNAESARLVLVLGDFGHGKTFLLRELARRLPTILPKLVPIVIELRALEKTHDLDNLLVLHLSKAGEDVIDIRAIRHMLARGQLLLMFDGFDELALRVSYDRAADYLRTLLSAVTGKAKVVITSRVQHFASDQQVRSALGEEVHLIKGSRILKVANFDDAQVREYLVRLHGGNEAEADDRLGLIHEIKDLLGLSRNPRMLSFIADLPVTDLLAIRAARGTISAGALYEKLLDRWLEFETTRRLPTRAAPLALSPAQLRAAATAVAMELWRTGEAGVDLRTLQETTRAVLTGLTQPPAARAGDQPVREAFDLTRLRMDPGQAAHAVGSGSLLVRDEDDRFGFVHASVLEYLVADETARMLGADGDVDVGIGPLAGREMSPLMIDFLCDALGSYPRAGERAADWATRTLGASGSSAAAVANAIAINGRLRLGQQGRRANLAGQDLRGRDLSSLDLRGADLSGANLRGCRIENLDLTGANLTDADLRGSRLEGLDLTDANLVGAWLSGAVLAGVALTRANLNAADFTGADLTDVDFTDASLRKTDLTESTLTAGRLNGSGSDETWPGGTRLAGSRWNQAAVLGTALDDATARTAKDAGALIAGQVPAELQVQPSGYDYDLLFVLGGQSVAVCYDSAVVLIDPLTGRPARTLPVPGTGKITLATNTAATVLFAARGDLVYIWDLSRVEPDQSVGDRPRAGRSWPEPAAPTVLRLSSPITALAVSPRGDQLATVHGANEIHVRRLAGRRAGSTVLRDSRHWKVTAIAFGPEGSRIASGGRNDGPASQTYQVRVWDIAAGKKIAALPQEDDVACIQFSPDGRLLATRSQDLAPHLSPVRLHDLVSGEVTELSTWIEPDWYSGSSHDDDDEDTRLARPGNSRMISFSPDGKTLAATSESKFVLFFPLESARDERPMLARSPQVTETVGISPDGRRFACGYYGGVAFGNLDDLQMATPLPATSSSYDGRSAAPAVAELVRFADAGRSVVTAYRDQSLVTWDLGTGRASVLSHLKTPLDKITVSGDGETVAVLSDRQVLLQNLDPDSTATLIPAERGSSTALSHDGSILAMGHLDEYRIGLWRHGRRWRQLQPAGPRNGGVKVLAISPENNLLATQGIEPGQDTTVWDLRSGDNIYTAPFVGPVAFAPDGQTLAGVVHKKGEIGVALWRVGTQTLFAESPVARRPDQLVFSPARQLIAAALEDTILIMDAGRPRAAGMPVFRTIQHGALSVAFSPSGNTLAAACVDGALRLWDMATGREQLVLVRSAHMDGWAAFHDGAYKLVGHPAGFWWTMGLRRFEPGELDPYVPSLRWLPEDAPFDLPSL